MSEIRGRAEVGLWKPGGELPGWCAFDSAEFLAITYTEGGANLVADTLNARETEREELALLREHFDLAYSGVLQSVEAVEEHAARVREAAQKVREWRAAHPEALEVRSDG